MVKGVHIDAHRELVAIHVAPGLLSPSTYYPYECPPLY